MYLNHRCSGVNHCSFILTKDCPGAEKWGFGNLTIKYACASEQRITRYCNRDIILPSTDSSGISEGFVHNPGYPRFYVGGRECRWQIRAAPFQKIKVTIFDIALVGNPNKNTCSDVLEISDPAQLLASACEQEELPTEVTSLGDSLDVTLIPSFTESTLPTRGVLFYYTTIGCPDPGLPDDAYLVHRNESAAEFSCCFGYVFPDLHRRRRIINCLGHEWDTPLPLPNCRGLEEINNSSAKQYPNITSTMVSKSTLEEIVIPSIIIVILFILNSIVLFVIYRYRQRKGTEFTREELGALSMPVVDT